MRGVSRMGLRFQVIAFMVLITILLVFALGFVWLRLLERNFIQMKYAQGDILAANFQHLLLDRYEGQSDFEFRRKTSGGLQSLLESFSNNLEIPEIYVVNTNRQIIAARRYTNVGRRFSDEDIDKAFATSSIQRRYISSDRGANLDPNDLVSITSPLFSDDETVAVLRLRLPMKDVAKASTGARRVLILYMLLTGIITALFGSLFLVKVVILPLRRLSLATQNVTDEKFDNPVAAHNYNEIGLLAKSLTRLHESLMEKEARVRQQTTRLEKALEKIKRDEANMIQQDRLAYVGRVAAGVAHEVGNPLAAVFNYLSVLSNLEILDPESRKMIERMDGELTRIDRIMKELLNFSRPQPAMPASIDLPALVRECVGILRDQRQLDNIETDIAVEQEIPRLVLDASQFKQVLLNVLINAVDAMSGFGKIEIRVGGASYEQTMLYESLLTPGRDAESRERISDLAARGIAFSTKPSFFTGEKLAVIHIRDYGPGLEPEKVQQVFDPFFTTKVKGKGTGLGLAICQRIIDGMWGLLRFESRQSEDAESGSVFSIYLPAEGENEANRES